jgi:hypothetical protein
MMQLLMTVSKWPSDPRDPPSADQRRARFRTACPKADSPAIWLKTRTPTLILLATLPVGLIIFVKYREGEDDLFLKVIDLVSERGLADDGPIPQYEHALLQRNWMPEFHYTAEDRVEYLRALDRFEWMRPLFTTVDWESRGRRKKGRFKWREGRRQGR